MNVREHLESYRQQVLLLAAIDWDLSKVGSTGAPGGIHAQQYTDAPRGTNNMAAASLQAWDGLLKRRNALAQGLAGEQRQEALRIITTEQDPRTMIILMLYYLHGLTDQQIADQLFISRRQANQRRNDFLHRYSKLP